MPYTDTCLLTTNPGLQITGSQGPERARVYSNFKIRSSFERSKSEALTVPLRDHPYPALASSEPDELCLRKSNWIARISDWSLILLLP